MAFFCFQCEQTALGKGCTKHQGVCGKKDHTAHLQDELTGAMIGLARVMEREEAPNDEVSKLVMKGLFTTVTNVNFNDPTIKKQVDDLHNLQKAIGGEIRDFDMQELWDANEDIRSLKSLILFGLRGMAAYAYHADVLGYHNEDVNAFFLTALRAAKRTWIPCWRWSWIPAMLTCSAWPCWIKQTQKPTEHLSRQRFP